MIFSNTEIILSIGLLVSMAYAFYQDKKIDTLKSIIKNHQEYNSWLFHSHQRICEVSEELLNFADNLRKKNEALHKELLQK